VWRRLGGRCVCHVYIPWHVGLLALKFLEVGARPVSED
jgi:hypothetical protein